MLILICPGIHPPKLTQAFLAQLQQHLDQDLATNLLIFPTQNYPAYSPYHILEFLKPQITKQTPLLLIGFSAGVVAAIGTAWIWQQQGGKIKGVIAFDGWGVPLCGDFPIHRLSHDYFTHWSSPVWGGGEGNFYADPAVSHLELWGAIEKVSGWQEDRSGQRRYCPALDFLIRLIANYANA